MGSIRPHYSLLSERIEQIGWKKLNYLQHSTDRAQLSLGMTFNVYSDNQGMERILHLDIIPRIINGKTGLHLKKDWNRGLLPSICLLMIYITNKRY